MIPMTTWMQSSLLRWQAVAPASPYGLVWPNKVGGPTEPRDDRAEWARLQGLAGFRHPAGRPYHVHEGRHTTITLLKGLGFEDEVIEQIVGHSRLVKNYVHIDMAPRTREALEALGNQLALE